MMLFREVANTKPLRVKNIQQLAYSLKIQVAAGILLYMSLIGKAIYNPCKHFDYISQDQCLLSVTLWSEPIARS